MEFYITDIEHDLGNLPSDNAEIEITTTNGTFTIWIETTGQTSKLVVEFGQGEQPRQYLNAAEFPRDRMPAALADADTIRRARKEARGALARWGE